MTDDPNIEARKNPVGDGPEKPIPAVLVPFVIILLLAVGATMVTAIWRPLGESVLIGSWIAMTAVVVRSDVQQFIIPDWATVTIAGLGCVNAVVTAPQTAPAWSLTITCLLRASVASATFYAIAAAYRWIRRQDGLGMGDIKLAGACAIWLSPAAQAAALEFAALSGIGLVLLIRVRQPRASIENMRLPFGALMAPAAVLVYLATQFN